MAVLLENLAPPEGPLGATQDAARWQPIAFDLTPEVGDLPLVMAEFGADPYDILTVFDGAAFSPLFADHSSAQEDSGTWSFSLMPTGGWPEDVNLTMAGVEMIEVLSYQMPDAPEVQAPGLSDLGRLLGRDILFRDGFVVGPHGDYMTVEETENLRLSIIRRFMTALREYQLNPGYGIGLEDAVKEPATTSGDNALMARAVEQLLSDRRITDVDRLDLVRPQGQPGLLRVYVSVIHVGSDSPLAFNFDAQEAG